MEHALAGEGNGLDFGRMIEQARQQEVWGVECPHHGFRRFMTACEVCELDRQRSEAVLQKHLNEAGAPTRYLGSRFADYGQDYPAAASALAAAREVVAGDALGLVLAGPTGVGKTLLAVATAHEWVDRMVAGERRGRALYATQRSLIDGVRESYRADSQISERQAIRQYVQAGLLIIDELGAGRNSADEQYHLAEVVNARHEQQRATILATNYPLSDLHQETPLDDRALSRIYSGEWRRVEVVGADRRVAE